MGGLSHRAAVQDRREAAREIFLGWCEIEFYGKGARVAGRWGV